jgi:Helix-turn-helix domain
MSVEALTVALHHSRATGTARLVLLGIANHDGDGGSWPAIATLAKYAGGVDRKTVKRAIDKLEELHEVEQLDREGGDRFTPDHLRPNLYRFLLTCPPTCDRTTQHRTKRGAGTYIPEQLDLSTPGAPTPRGSAAPGAPTPRGEGAPTPPEPSLEPNPLDRAVEPTTERASVCSITGDAHEVSARYGRCVYCGESRKP